MKNILCHDIPKFVCDNFNTYVCQLYVPKLFKIMLVLVIWFVNALIFTWIKLNWIELNCVKRFLSSTSWIFSKNFFCVACEVLWNIGITLSGVCPSIPVCPSACPSICLVVTLFDSHAFLSSLHAMFRRDHMQSLECCHSCLVLTLT